MRTTLFFIAILFSCIFWGCKEEEEVPVENFPPPRGYYAEFHLLDMEGRNIVEDISYNPDEYENSTDLREVYSGVYTVQCVEYPRQSELWLEVRLSDNPSFLLNNTLWIPFSEQPEVLTYTISSFRIFGDEAEHTLVTYWRDNNYECYRIDLDGETFGAGDDGIVEVVVRK